MPNTWTAGGPSDRVIVYGMETAEGPVLIHDGMRITSSISGFEPDQTITVQQLQALSLIRAQLEILPRELLPDLAADLQDVVADLCAMHSATQQGPQYEKRVFLPGKLV